MQEKQHRLPDIVFRWEEQNFTQIPNEMLRDPVLSAKAKGLLCLLLSNREGWFSYMEVIQSMMSDGKTSILSGIKELEEEKYLLRLRYRDTNGKKAYRGSIWSCTSVKGMFDLEYVQQIVEEAGYTLEIPNKYLKDEEKAEKPGDMRDGSTTRFPTCGKPTCRKPAGNNIKVNNTNKKNIDYIKDFFPKKENENIPIQGRNITPSMFEKFWKLYPRKVDKGKAKTKWDQLCRKTNRPTWTIIESAITAQIKTPRWQQNSSFIPHPTTWLNQQRWLDDPEEMQVYDYGTKEPSQKKNGKDTPLNKSNITPEQLIKQKFDSLYLTREFTEQCYLPAAGLIQMQDSSKEELVRVLIILYDAIKRERHQKAVVSSELLPGFLDIISLYLEWLQENDWITNKTITLFDPSHTLFRRFCRELAKQDNLERHPITGESYMRDGDM